MLYYRDVSRFSYRRSEYVRVEIVHLQEVMGQHDTDELNAATVDPKGNRSGW